MVNVFWLRAAINRRVAHPAAPLTLSVERGIANPWPSVLLTFFLTLLFALPHSRDVFLRCPTTAAGRFNCTTSLHARNHTRLHSGKRTPFHPTHITLYQHHLVQQFVRLPGLVIATQLSLSPPSTPHRPSPFLHINIHLLFPICARPRRLPGAVRAAFAHVRVAKKRHTNSPTIIAAIQHQLRRKETEYQRIEPTSARTTTLYVWLRIIYKPLPRQGDTPEAKTKHLPSKSTELCHHLSSFTHQTLDQNMIRPMHTAYKGRHAPGLVVLASR
jgi:hypothetical protein